VWPLPPPGTLTFGVEWLARGIDLTLHEIDAALVRDAAGRARTLFAAEDMPDTTGFSIGTMHLVKDED
jgi:hypothetical protein